jgi:hypothetical protein
MTQQTTLASQRRQNDQNGCVKAWKFALDMNVIETKKQQENDHKHGMIVCTRHEKDEK